MLIEILLALAVFPLVGFIYRYARYSPWWSTWQGRILMTQKAAMLALVLFYLAADLIDFPYKEAVKTVLLFILVALFWAMYLALLDAQTEQRPVKKSHGTGLVPTEDLERTYPPRRNK